VIRDNTDYISVILFWLGVLGAAEKYICRRAVCEAALPLSFVSLKILHVSLN